MGRENILQDLHEELQRHSICHLYGPEGSGTTQSALAYVFRARSNFDAVFWLDGRSALTLRFDFSQAIDVLNLATHKDLGHRERLDLMSNWLNTHDRWLIVVDGLCDYGALEALLPSHLRGKILVTGHRSLEHPAAHIISHSPLNDEAARIFLGHRSQQLDAGGLEGIVSLMEGRTLPLYLSAALCHSARVSLLEYAARITQRLEGMKSISTQERARILDKAVVEQSLQYVSTQNPAALELMALCAHFDVENIPLVTLYDGAPFLPKRLSACVTDQRALDQALSLLYRLGLIQFEQNSIALHPLVQQATRELLGKEQGNAWLMTALRVVLETFPVEAQYTHTIPLCSLLLPHTLAVAKLSEAVENLHEGTGALLNQVGLYLHACDELELACTCIKRSIVQAESLYGSSVHPTVASRTNSLGVVLQDQGRYEEARDCYQHAFKLCEEIYGPARDAVLGPAHRSMLTTPSRNLCQVLELMDDFPAAKSAYERAIETFIEVYSWNHPRVAECMSGLGQLYRKKGEHGLAQQYFLKAVQAEENAEEENAEAVKPGPLSQYVRHLAQSLLETGQVEEAQRFYEHALDYDRRNFGAVHERVASGLQGLARCHRARDRHDAAHQCLDEALAIWGTLAESPTLEKALLWRQKGRCYLDAKTYEEARVSLQKALAITEAAAGPNSTALGPDYIYLGRALGRLEQHAEARDSFREALHLHESVSWLEDDGLIVLYGRLVRACRNLQEFDQAAVFQKQLLDLRQQHFGSADERVGADAYSLGNLHLASGDSLEAKRYLQMALDIYTTARGPDDERTIRVQRKLSTLPDREDQDIF